MQRNGNNIPSWDLYSIGIISLFTILQIIQWPLLPKFVDIYYHLGTMSGFAEAGGYVSSCFWEYAPVGRPNLYPPLLHILMLMFYKFGLSPISIARLFDCFIYPFSLLVIWLIIRQVFSFRFAFFVILIWSSVYSLYLATVNFIPSTLSLLLTCFTFLCIEKKRAITAVIFTGLNFYTHTPLGLLGLLAILLYGIFNKKNLRLVLRVAAGGILLGAPFLLFQYRNQAYFSFARPFLHNFIDINPLIYLLACIGFFLAVKKKQSYYFFPSLVITMLPLALTHLPRYLGGQGLAGYIFLTALTVDFFYERFCRIPNRSRNIWFFISVIFCFHIFSPVLSLDIKNKQTDKRFFDSTIFNLLPTWKKHPYLTEGTIYYPKFIDPVVNIIKNNTHNDDIIYINYPNSHLGVLSNRATSSGMLLEVKPYREFDRIAVAKLIIWFKQEDGGFPLELSKLINKYNLRKLAETEIAYIYANPQPLAKKIVKKATLPSYIIFPLLFSLMAIAILSYFKNEP